MNRCFEFCELFWLVFESLKTIEHFPFLEFCQSTLYSRFWSGFNEGTSKNRKREAVATWPIRNMESLITFFESRPLEESIPICRNDTRSPTRLLCLHQIDASANQIRRGYHMLTGCCARSKRCTLENYVASILNWRISFGGSSVLVAHHKLKNKSTAN